MQSASHAEKPLGAKSVAHATRLDCTLLAAVGARRVRMQQRGWRLVVGDRVAQVEAMPIGEKLASRFRAFKLLPPRPSGEPRFIFLSGSLPVL